MDEANCDNLHGLKGLADEIIRHNSKRLDELGARLSFGLKSASRKAVPATDSPLLAFNE